MEEGAKNCLTPDQPSRTVNQAQAVAQNPTFMIEAQRQYCLRVGLSENVS